MSGKPERVAVPTVAEYVVQRLAALGIGHVFGVPGDYAFPFNDAIEADPDVEWVGCANELNAAYAADGYARIHGAAILSTTFGVGELSALNGVMGSKAERCPVFHLVGQPSTKLQRLRRATHHTLGDGEFGDFRPISGATACVSADLTPQNAVSETERVIREVVQHRQPGYITVAQDLALKPIAEPPAPAVSWDQLPQPVSDPSELDAAVAAIVARLDSAASPVVLPAVTIDRYGLKAELEELLEVSGFGYVTAPMGKAVISEDHPQYLGMYNGLLSAPEVTAAVQGADVILDLGGVIFEDFNTGGWTQQVPAATSLIVEPHRVVIGDDVYSDVVLGDVLRRLIEHLAAGSAQQRKPAPAEEPTAAEVPGVAGDQLSSAAFYPRLEQFLREGDIVVCETGLAQAALGRIRLPKDVSYLVQVLWGSIGWATPAAFGAAVAARDRRVVLITGDGSHQLTANELGAMGRYGVAPVIFVLNNDVFGVEEFLAPTQGHDYNDLAAWNYHAVPAAMGCTGWQTARVSTVGELESALADAVNSATAVYLEVVLPRSDVPPSVPDMVIERLYGIDLN